jgi:hypothetical protein
MGSPTSRTKTGTRQVHIPTSSIPPRLLFLDTSNHSGLKYFCEQQSRPPSTHHHFCRHRPPWRLSTSPRLAHWRLRGLSLQLRPSPRLPLVVLPLPQNTSYPKGSLETNQPPLPTLQYPPVLPSPNSNTLMSPSLEGCQSFFEMILSVLTCASNYGLTRHDLPHAILPAW